MQLHSVNLNTARYSKNVIPRQHNCFLFLSICLVSTFLLIPWIYWRIARTRRPRVLPIDAVHALSAVFTPTSSAWPAKFAYYFASASIIRGRRSGVQGDRQGDVLGYGKGQGVIEVDLSALVGYILAGDIELRDPRDFGPLWEGSLRIYAWNIRLRAGWDWWLKVARWLAVQHVLGANPLSMQSPPILVADPPSYVDLDFIGFQDLEAYMRNMSNYHQSPTSITVEFSSIKPEIRFMSPDFLLCAITMIPGWQGDRQDNRGSTRNNKPIKTSTPLFIQLQDVVTCIASTKSFKITSIANISAQHEASLLSNERDLVEKQNLRTSKIRETGTRGWREERMRLAWEAGLVRAGLLHRWNIQLSRG